jgi:hypothetical protein
MIHATTTTKTLEEQLTDELYLRSVVDAEFRSEYAKDMDASALPSPVIPPDMTFAEVVKDSVTASCINTCISGFTIQCDGNTLDPGCRNTCITGWTIRCDGNTL